MLAEPKLTENQMLENLIPGIQPRPTEEKKKKKRKTNQPIFQRVFQMVARQVWVWEPLE